MNSLAQLIQANQQGQLSSLSKGARGFYDSRTSKRRRLCGIGTFLHKKTTVFPKLSLREYRSKRSLRVKGTKASNKRTGSSFHKHIHHALFCASGPCICPEGPVKRRPPKGSYAYNMVRGALKFVRDSNMAPLTGETVIACANVPLGTRFDCLTRDQSSRNVLVSWKTGYDSIARLAPSVIKGEFMMADEDDRKRASSETIALREHIAQVTCELHMLRDEHQVDVDRACIVYLSPQKDGYQTVELDRSWVTLGYQRGWKWMLENSVFTR
jgi:hypothetical protein